MEQLGIETLPFDDCLCQVHVLSSLLSSSLHLPSSSTSMPPPRQMLDMIRPKSKHAITLKDLKQCKMTPVFFDTFFNLEKYLDHEQRDPFATQRETDEDGNEVTLFFTSFTHMMTTLDMHMIAMIIITSEYNP